MLDSISQCQKDIYFQYVQENDVYIFGHICRLFKLNYYDRCTMNNMHHASHNVINEKKNNNNNSRRVSHLK